MSLSKLLKSSLRSKYYLPYNTFSRKFSSTNTHTSSIINNHSSQDTLWEEYQIDKVWN